MRKGSNRGVALLTVLIVLIIGSALVALGFYLISKGNQTYGYSKNYAKAFNRAQGGLEEVVSFLNDSTFDTIENQVGNERTATSGAKYWVWRVFWKPLSGFGGAASFPPVSSAYSGISGIGVFYLIHSCAIQGESQADLYMMYVKGY